MGFLAHPDEQGPLTWKRGGGTLIQSYVLDGSKSVWRRGIIFYNPPKFDDLW